METDIDRIICFLHEAEEAHREVEPDLPTHDWARWYGAFIIARQRGEPLVVCVSQATAYATEVAP